MKKMTKRISLALTALAAVSAMSAMAIGASAEDYGYDYEAPDADYGCGDYFGKPLPERNSFKVDPNAPLITRQEMIDISERSEKVNQYDIKPGEYYLLKIGEIHTTGGDFHSIDISEEYEYCIVKATNVYEDSALCGTERTVDFIYCDTGATGKAHPNRVLTGFYKLPTSKETNPAAEASSESVAPIDWLNNKYPCEKELKRMGLDDIVCKPESGWSDYFYDTYRGNGEWQHVGSLDMVKYVGRTLGENDPRYKMLVEFYNNGRKN